MGERQQRKHCFKNIVSLLNSAFVGDLELAKDPLGIFADRSVSRPG